VRDLEDSMEAHVQGGDGGESIRKGNAGSRIISIEQKGDMEDRFDRLRALPNRKVGVST
jgi:hypothetical protein